MTWDPLAQPVDYILLAGEKSPGLADVRMADSPRRWDERNGYGLSGATVVYRGAGLSHFSVFLRLYSQTDWANWHDWKRLVDKPPVGKRPRAQDIWHPLLEDLEIKSVVVEDVLQADQTDDGEWTIEIKFIQFRRPVFALAKPEASTATPADPVEAQIGELTKQVQQLAGPP